MAFFETPACRATLTELEGISWRVFAWTRESTSWMRFMNLVEMTKWRSVVACFFHWSMISRPCLSAFDVIRVRATAKELNDAKKYGPHAEPHFFLQRGMRCVTDPIEPGHVSIERPIFTFPFAQPEGLLLLAWALGGFLWPRPSGPDGREAGPAFFYARRACTHRGHFSRLTFMLD